MPFEISVGPPVLTINQGSTFMVTDLNGEIAADSEQGVFAGDTRFVSYYALFANGEPWVRLSSSPTSYFAARIYLTNSTIATEDGEIPAGTLALTVTRAVGDGIHEDLDLTNHGMKAIRFNLEIAIRSDFADLFEVKSHKFVQRGRIETEWHKQQRELRTSYSNGDFRRSLIYRLLECAVTPHYANGRVTFELELAPGGTWHSCCYYILVQDDRVRLPLHNCEHVIVGSDLDERQRRWLERATRLRTSNVDVSSVYCQSVEDMGALRLFEPDLGPDVWLPAAGVPWFVAVFGRDSLIVSLQNLMVYPDFARGALSVRGKWQANEVDDDRDAQPGKILHEMRFGELAERKLIPHTPY